MIRGTLMYALFATFILAVSAQSGSFWHVSDHHYDFSYWSDMYSCNEQPVSRGVFGDYWCDSPWRLIADSLDAMKAIEPNVDFILWTGDNVAHIDDAHLSVAKNVEIMRNITDILKTTFPNVPVYATMGNHDYWPSDQFPPHNSDLYNQTADLWSDWIQDPAEVERFRNGAYYTVKTAHGLRVLALNTNLYYTSDKVTNPVNFTDPAGQFAWMESILTAARTAKEQVLVTGHVAPAISTPTSAMWFYEEFNTRFMNIIEEYADIIVGMHFGHDHADGMKVIYKQGKPSTPLFLAPSITPWRFKIPNLVGEAHNPGIRVVDYNRTSSKHLNVKQYYIDLQSSNRENSTDWKLEYNLKQVYQLADASAASLDQAFSRMAQNSSMLDNYIKFRMVMANPGDRVTDCDKKCRGAILCGFKNHHWKDFTPCRDNYVGVANTTTTSFVFMTLLLAFAVFIKEE